jgi:outer membrane protein assembly factor BamB
MCDGIPLAKRSVSTLLVVTPARLRAVVFAAVFWGCFSRSAESQVFVVGGNEGATANEAQHPFLLPSQPTEIGEAMEDFRRFSGRKQWEKGFKHLEKVFNATSNGLVLTADGIMLPSRMIAREALLELPAAGQDAYRLFFDAEAKKLLEQAQGKDELLKLTQVFSRFLVTSVGDVAADRLGDLHFEAGRFAQAANAWRTVLEQRPDSRISRVRLRVKIGIALARQQHWSEFQELIHVVHQQHASDKLILGGKDVSAVDHLQALLERNRDAKAGVFATSVHQSPVDILLSGTVEPLWQFRFFTAGDNPETPPGLRLQNMWGQPSVSDFVPPVATDDTRLYVNFLGYDLSLDMASGKLLWRSGRFFDAPQKVQQGIGMPVEQHGLATSAGRTWSVSRETNDQGQQAKFGIMSREADTGKKIFHSKEAAELSGWSLRGTPLISGEYVYLAASKANQGRELEVLALNAKDGKLVWSAPIGSYTAEPQSYQMERSFQPSLLIHDGHLYVDSHSGSLVQLDAASGQMEWGLNYSSESPQSQRFWSPYGMRSESFTVSPPQIVNGILYLKGMRSRKLYAVDPQRPKVLWHRSVPRVATLIGVDEQRFYLGGEDISAFDLATRKIVWSVKVNLGTSWARPLLTQGRIYHFSGRGIFEIDKADGRVVRVFRGSDLQSLGGQLVVTPKALLSISNLAITAYPLLASQPEVKSDANQAAVVPAADGAVN